MSPSPLGSVGWWNTAQHMVNPYPLNWSHVVENLHVGADAGARRVRVRCRVGGGAGSCSRSTHAAHRTAADRGTTSGARGARGRSAGVVAGPGGSAMRTGQWRGDDGTTPGVDRLQHALAAATVVGVRPAQPRASVPRMG